MVRLLTTLEAQGLKVRYVHDSAAKARDLGFPILAGHTFDSTAWLIAEAMRLEAEATLEADVILVDRPMTDALGYLAAALRHTGRELEPDRYRRLERVCAAWSGEYDLVFLTSLDATIELGPGRDGDAVFRTRAAAAVTEIVDRLHPQRHILASDGLEAAVTLALEAIETWRDRP